MNLSGIVLCGGRSTRMGFSKAWLPFGPEVLLQRVVRLLSELVEPVVVVAAPQQELPELPREVRVVHDRREGCGPLEGLHAGLSSLPAQTATAFVTSCDVPLLLPAFVRYLHERMGSHDVVVPVDGSLHHPLSAVYRTTVLPHIEELLATDQFRPVFLYERVKTLRIPVSELRDVDPCLDSLANLNHPHDYAAALERAGFTVPHDVASRLRGTS